MGNPRHCRTTASANCQSDMQPFEKTFAESLAYTAEITPQAFPKDPRMGKSTDHHFLRCLIT